MGIMMQRFLLSASQWRTCFYPCLPSLKKKHYCWFSRQQICTRVHLVFPFPSHVLGKLSLLRWLSQTKTRSKGGIRTLTKSSSIFTAKCDLEWWRCHCGDRRRERQASLTRHRYPEKSNIKRMKNHVSLWWLYYLLSELWAIAVWVSWMRVTLKNDKMTPKTLERGSLQPLDIYAVGSTGFTRGGKSLFPDLNEPCK